MSSGVVIVLVVAVVCMLLVPIFYSDNNQRKAKANADAIKEVLKELEREKEHKE